MSGLPEYNYPAFDAACVFLRDVALLCVKSPHEIKHGGRVRGDRPYTQYMIGGFRLLMECDRIIMLPEWTSSKGARRELDVALDCGMPAYIMSEDNTLRDLSSGEVFNPWRPQWRYCTS
jgi:hypothetical protein